MSKQNNVFVEFHALTSHAPSNLNRDDLGSPKSAQFGGHRRLRISSQCLKRTWRMSDFFRGELAEDLLGVRTSQLPSKLRAELQDSTDGQAPLSVEVLDGLVALMASLGKSSKTVSNEGADDGEDDAAASPDATTDDETVADAETAHLLFVSRQEIEAIKVFAHEKADKLAKVASAGAKSKKKAAGAGAKGKGGAIDELRKALQKHLEEHCQRNAVDIALFGRFVTSPEIPTIDAALQVAHALGTQKAEVEYDYFSAVDDLTTGTGAGHIGETEFAASVFYKYAVCDLRLLRKNLAGDAQLSAQAMRGVVQALARTVPRGKINGTAPHSPADYVEVVVRRDAPISMVNAFLEPVRPGPEGDVMATSIARFQANRDRYSKMYGEDVIARFILNVRELESLTLKDLTDRLEGAVLQSLGGAPGGTMAEAS